MINKNNMQNTIIRIVNKDFNLKNYSRGSNYIESLGYRRENIKIGFKIKFDDNYELGDKSIKFNLSIKLFNKEVNKDITLNKNGFDNKGENNYFSKEILRKFINSFNFELNTIDLLSLSNLEKENLIFLKILGLNHFKINEYFKDGKLTFNLIGPNRENVDLINIINLSLLNKNDLNNIYSYSKNNND